MQTVRKFPIEIENFMLLSDVLRCQLSEIKHQPRMVLSPPAAQHKYATEVREGLAEVTMQILSACALIS